MKPQVKVPPPSPLPKGLMALVAPLPRRPSPAEDAAPQPPAEPIEATRAWKPNRDLLQTDPQPEKLEDFASAAEESTMVGAIDLNDPSLFRSAPPPAAGDANLECDDDDNEDGEAVEFVGALAALAREETQSKAAPPGSEEQTQLYRPQRPRLEDKEITDEFELTATSDEAPALGPEPPKVIIAPAVLAGLASDPTRAEATKKKKRRALPTSSDSKLGLVICLLGVLAVALSVAWRHPRAKTVTHDALAKVRAPLHLLGR